MNLVLTSYYRFFPRKVNCFKFYYLCSHLKGSLISLWEIMLTFHSQELNFSYFFIITYFFTLFLILFHLYLQHLIRLIMTDVFTLALLPSLMHIYLKNLKVLTLRNISKSSFTVPQAI